MDAVSLIKDFGFPVACVILLGWWIYATVTDRISKLEDANGKSQLQMADLNRYIREDLAKLAGMSQVREREAHQREKVLSELLRKHGYQPTPMDEDDTTRILSQPNRKPKSGEYPL